MIQISQITILYPAGTQAQALANALAGQLKHYRIPRSVRAQSGIASIQDVSEPWMIVLCTPDTTKDPQILQMIDSFIDRGLYQHILTLLVDGTPETSFPDSLLHERLPDGTVIDHEPLAANVSDVSGSKKIRKLRTEKLRLLAPVLGVTFDELLNRRRRQRVRILLVLGPVLLALGVAFLTITWRRIHVFRAQNSELTRQYDRAADALAQTQKMADDAARSYAQAVASGAQEILQTGDCELTMLMCLTLLPERSDVSELTDVFTEALSARSASGYVPVTAVQPDSGEEESAEADFGEEVSTEPDSGNASPGNADSGDNRMETEEPVPDLPSDYGLEWSSEYSSEGYLLCVYGESELRVYDPEKGRFTGSMTSFTYPLYAADTAFAGDPDPQSGLRSADRIRCGNIIFEDREEQLSVPESLEEQISLANEFLNGRTLSQDELDEYGIS